MISLVMLHLKVAVADTAALILTVQISAIFLVIFSVISLAVVEETEVTMAQ